MLKKITSIIIILNISLCFYTVVLANEISRNTNEEVYGHTLMHELGHAFTLGHSICSYEPITWKSSTKEPPKSYEITMYDAYNNTKSKSNTNNTKNVTSTKITYSEFDIPIKNINDIEKEARYIIKGKVLENNKNVLTPEGGGYTETNLEITDVYKGDLNIGDIITLVELYYTSKDGIEIRRDGYSASTLGEEYLFYIGTQYDDGTYGMVCTIFGRYSLDDTQTLNDNSIEANVVEEYAPLYNQLKTEVMNIYKK